ncbi:hypothetical protein [Solimonas marina]|uniref:Lipoprotein n=1 Tax=Solimonas marina TaxID=2714601 RepID=A0A969WDB0_9GAMM|nr:hypothetical protein [Solimonas marina]NKF23296.1 hypothetical protein [Solimonas marina]
MKTSLPLLLSATALLAACSWFVPQPDSDLVERVHKAIPDGTPLEAAEETLHRMNFNCARRRGSYTDEAGTNHDDAYFSECTELPTSKISLSCSNRNQVILVPNSQSLVRSVSVIRSPYCGS